jgi:hypothetical protein
MKDIRARIEKLRMDAEDCMLISKLATDRIKSQTFRSWLKNIRRWLENWKRSSPTSLYRKSHNDPSGTVPVKKRAEALF